MLLRIVPWIVQENPPLVDKELQIQTPRGWSHLCRVMLPNFGEPEQRQQYVDSMTSDIADAVSKMTCTPGNLKKATALARRKGAFVDG